jgi:hypothetical protein
MASSSTSRHSHPRWPSSAHPAAPPTGGAAHPPRRNPGRTPRPRRPQGAEHPHGQSSPGAQYAVAGARYGKEVSEPRDIIELEIRLSGEPVSSETTATWSGPDVLAIATVLPDRGLAFDLTSTFVGHKGIDTHVTHLTLGPPGEDPEIHTEDHPHERLNPTYDPRGCAYEHIHVLMEYLNRLGYEPAIDIPDNAFQELERVES